MIGRPATSASWTLWAIAGLVISAALVSSPGLFNIDEVIYHQAAATLAAQGRLAISNGFETFAADGLRLWLLIEGPDGLVPQYPAGQALIGAPLVALLGPRGLILLNAAAAVASVFLCRALAWRLYGDQALATRAALIFALASFLLEYALGIWPHALSLCFVLAALLCGAGAVLGRPERTLILAALTGLWIGLGTLVRVDAVLILPPLALWAVLFAARPLVVLAMATLGLGPGLAAAAWLNALKFGDPNPLSYGASGGPVAVTSYLGLAGAGLLLVVGLFGARAVWRRARWRRPLVGGVVALACAAALVPEIQAMLGRGLHGIHALILDSTVIQDPRQGVVLRPDGTLSFWGLSKKALGQSLPWIGVLTFLLLARWRPEDRPRHVLCLLVAALWMLPFLLRAWHGGLGSNMRYFLPIVPVLAILAAHVWRDLAAQAGRGGGVAWLLGIALAGLGLVLVVGLHPGALNAAQQVAPTWLLLALAAAAFVAALPGRAERSRAEVARVLLVAGLAVAFVMGSVLDPLFAERKRAAIQELNAAFAGIAERSLVIGGPASAFSFQVDRAQGLLALEPDQHRGRSPAPVDSTLVDAALAEGYRVYIFLEERLGRYLDADPTLVVLAELPSSAGLTLYEVGRSQPAP